MYGHRADAFRRGETAGQYGIGGICPKGPGEQGHKALDNGERMCDARPVRREAERSVPGTGSRERTPPDPREGAGVLAAEHRGEGSRARVGLRPARSGREARSPPGGVHHGGEVLAVEDGLPPVPPVPAPVGRRR
ncbi:hypothetical protein SAMN05216505_108176 [Streptomyces prasinopilosus]|uniref:Uncharacterized protein n=1 Tax=Streptomyces prasinopilosus TaxID=67344 RepID=A0A1G6V8Z5_9ACTN|nr:hypothetical protein SAMN05216505_108176 [Streptomyces prasinopilosus]